MKKKEIRIQTWSPIYVFPVDEFSVDVWISYHVGKKIVNEAPCIFGIKSAKREMETNNDMISDPEISDELREQLVAENIKMKESLEKAKIDGFSLLNYDNNGLPDILINENYVNRENVEKYLALYLQSKGFKGNFTFRWNKPKDFVLAMNNFQGRSGRAV